MGVLKYLSEQVADPEFKILLGSSAGAINVAALASQTENFKQSVENMVHIWSNIRIEQVLRIDFLSLSRMAFSWIFNLLFSGLTGKSIVNSLIDSTPLRSLIFQIFKPEKVKANLESGKFETLAVVATEVSSASSVTFVQGQNHNQWKRANRRSEAAVISHKHILASSAIPFLFKSIRIGHRQFLDGSVRSNTPLSPAARLGATEIFSIGVRKVAAPSNPINLQSAEFESEPTVAQIAGLVLNSLFSDSLDSDADHLVRINQLLTHVDHDMAQRTVGMKPINVFLLRPSEDIGKIAKQYSYCLPFFLRLLLRSLGSEKSQSSDIVSYLLFDSRYAKHLIDLGYRDAEKAKTEMLQFFKGSKV